MIFCIGGFPKRDIFFEGAKIERVNEFKYLGVTLSTQLSFSSHLKEVSKRARARLGLLNSQLSFRSMELSLALKLFGIYILPIIEYASPTWINRRRDINSTKYFNATLTKFLKRYLGIPTTSDNALTHFICETKPLIDIIKERSLDRFLTISQPTSVPSINFTTGEITPYHAFLDVPTEFWRGRQLTAVPHNPYFRKKILNEIFDSNHYLGCSNLKFHTVAEEACLCNECGEPNHYYHSLYYCNS